MESKRGGGLESGQGKDESWGAVDGGGGSAGL